MNFKEGREEDITRFMNDYKKRKKEDARKKKRSRENEIIIIKRIK